MLTYVHRRLFDGGDRALAVQLFLAARIFDPCYIVSITLSKAVTLVKSLSCFPAIDSEILEGLLLEIPQYKESAENEVSKGLEQCISPINWHYKFSGQYGIILSEEEEEKGTAALASGILPRPFFFKAACLLVKLLPTCASCDRVFSMLDARFSKRQKRALSDYITASLMLGFNDRDF